MRSVISVVATENQVMLSLPLMSVRKNLQFVYCIFNCEVFVSFLMYITYIWWGGGALK